MHGHGLIEIKVAANGLHVVEMIEEVQSLQHIRLFDKAAAQDMVPRPVLVDGPLPGGNVRGGHQFLVQEGVMLHEDTQFRILRIVHLFHHVNHVRKLVLCDGQLPAALLRRTARLGDEQPNAPGRDAVGVPVVVDVVLIFIGASDAMNHVFAMSIGKMHAVGVEPGNAAQHVQSLAQHVVHVAGIGGIVEDGMGDGAVSMDLLKGDLPFVVALHAGKGHHGIQRALQALLPRVVVGAVQLKPAVEQQLLGHVLTGDGHVDRQAVCLGIPVGGAAVFFAGEALGPDVEACIIARIGAEQLEEVEADALLGRVVALNGHVAARPAVAPGRGVRIAQRVIPHLASARGGLERQGAQHLFVIVAAGEAQGVLFHNDVLTRRHVPLVAGFHIPAVQPAPGHLQPVRPAAHGGADGKARRAEGILLRFGQKGQRILGFFFLQHIPEGFFIIAVQVAHVGIQIRAHHHVCVIIRREVVAHGQQFLLRQRYEALRLHLHAAPCRAHGEAAQKQAVLHIQFPVKHLYLRSVQIQRLAIHLHMDAV